MHDRFMHVQRRCIIIFFLAAVHALLVFSFKMFDGHPPHSVSYRTCIPTPHGPQSSQLNFPDFCFCLFVSQRLMF